MRLHGCLLFAFQRHSSKSRNTSLKTFCLCSKFTITLVDVGIHNALKGRLQVVHTECTSHGRDIPLKSSPSPCVQKSRTKARGVPHLKTAAEETRMRASFSGPWKSQSHQSLELHTRNLKRTAQHHRRGSAVTNTVRPSPPQPRKLAPHLPLEGNHHTAPASWCAPRSRSS